MLFPYTTEYSCEEEPMGDIPSFECAQKLLAKAETTWKIEYAKLNLHDGPVEAVVLNRPGDNGWIPEVWQHDADEADGGWYYTLNRMLKLQDSGWRFRMPTWEDDYINEYLMCIRWYEKADPRLRNLSVLEGR